MSLFKEENDTKQFSLFQNGRETLFYSFIQKIERKHSAVHLIRTRPREVSNSPLTEDMKQKTRMLLLSSKEQNGRVSRGNFWLMECPILRDYQRSTAN
ncbi:hypothetical protein CEXT_437041 [Caerostris extrusa]|uniref:Uncharacterized protein n=1 Tax=Caerostris extrusa TaxID=172846 RepID=A0AAV4PGW9_CAEEX|nr:hypothetical protein CEXT_437041 [Caerostris extrusa]